jgi:hypothetical protein
VSLAFRWPGGSQGPNSVESIIGRGEQSGLGLRECFSLCHSSLLVATAINYGEGGDTPATRRDHRTTERGLDLILDLARGDVANGLR